MDLEIDAFPDFTASDKWHPLPAFHIKAPRGWINDPCAPGYHPATKLHHLFYQWNPNSCNWENISWGHLTSKDGVRWTYMGSEPALKPSMPYDKDGIFTGCLYPTGPHGEPDQLTLFYTSTCHLPIHWTVPHIRGGTGLALATSKDKGQTWQKHELNPILVCEPVDDIVTGFRDPYLAKWPVMDKIRGQVSLYGIISGGILGKGPTSFLYAVQPNDLTNWEYISPLVDLPPGFCPPGEWCSDYGMNWECVQFMSLKDEAEHESHFLICSANGGANIKVSSINQALFDGENLWMSGPLKSKGKGAVMEYSYGGILDYGPFYAANSYENPVTGARILWGWLKEEDLPPARCSSKGWIGYLTLPREMFALTIPNVVRALKTPLDKIGSIHLVPDISTGTYKVQTLGQRPLAELESIRTKPVKEWKDVGQKNARGLKQLTNAISWEVQAVIRVLPHHKRVGFHVRHNDDFSQRTSIYFSAEDEEIVLCRKNSNFEEDIGKPDYKGPFTLFTTKRDGVETVEKLRLHIFGDGDILEIYANDRFVMSGVTYADTSMSTGISCYCEGGDFHDVVFESIKIWEDLDGVEKTEKA